MDRLSHHIIGRAILIVFLLPFLLHISAPTWIAAAHLPASLPVTPAHLAGALDTEADSSLVLTAGQIRLRVTNRGYLGHLGPSAPDDPSGQWPGASGIEYLGSIALAVAAVDHSEADPTRRRRVSFLREWGPASLDPVDRVYQSYDGQVYGTRYRDDDLDSQQVDPLDASLFVDEDFLDGHDNDGDGLIDEDYAAVGSEMFSLVMHDDGPLGTSEDPGEPHRPLGLECRQLVWAYSVPGYRDFAAIEYTIINRSGHVLDSLTIGWRVDLDAGPKGTPLYKLDDRDLPQVPSGEFSWVVPSGDPRRQQPHAFIPAVPPDSALCARLNLRVHGFSLADDSGDGCLNTGIGTFLLLAHTTDPSGNRAPARVGFRAFRSNRAGTPFSAGGEPGNDRERFVFMTGNDGIDPATGFINASPGTQSGDYVSWCSVGPFREVPDGGAIQVTIAFAVAGSQLTVESEYVSDYAAYRNGLLSDTELFTRHPPLVNALNIAAAYEGNYDNPPSELADDNNINTPDFHGRETRVRAPEGYFLFDSDCRDEGAFRQINEFGYTWFDYDCDWCTGVWAFGFGPGGGTGLYLRRWDTTRSPIVAIGADPNPPPVRMSFSLKPTTLNLRSMGRWVTGLLEPAAPFTASDIEIGSILVNGTVPVDTDAPTVIGDHNGNGVTDLAVKIDRGSMDLTLIEGHAVPVSVTGLVDNHCFYGTAQIRVLRAVVSAPAAGSVLAAGSVTTVRWEVPPGTQGDSVALLASFDDGTSWVLQASDLPNTGSHDWMVPGPATNQARVLVVLAESSDEGAYVVDAVLGMSGMFSILDVTGVGPGAQFELALRGVTPNPAQHLLQVSFSLPDAGAATLALYDVSGRQVLANEVGGLGPGHHTMTMGERTDLPAGIYLVRLTQDRRSLTSRAALIR